MKGSILWEQHREEKDKYFVEQNLLITNLIQCHNNTSVISGRDSGEAVEEYLTKYFAKEAASLRQAAGVLLAAIEHIQIHPSRADDKHTLSRNSIHLAQRTVNAFSGSHQWSLPIMASALLGHRSHITSDSYRYIFPHENSKYYDFHFVHEKNDETIQQRNGDKSYENPLFVEECLDALVVASENCAETIENIGGTATYRIKKHDSVVLVSQAESYLNRGPNFVNMNLLEFECIVALKEKKDDYVLLGGKKVGRSKREGFDLGEKHPLYDSHEGVIRCKMLNPILAGKPPPSYPGPIPKSDDKTPLVWFRNSDDFAKYIIDLMVPWPESGDNSIFDRNYRGLLRVCELWSSEKASLVSRLRYQYITNLISKSHRSSFNEMTVSAWRERNCDKWSDMKNVDRMQNKGESHCMECFDENNELEGKLSTDEILAFTELLGKAERSKAVEIQRIARQYAVIFPNDSNVNKNQCFEPSINQSPVYINHDDHRASLADVRKQIHQMSIDTAVDDVTTGNSVHGTCPERMGGEHNHT
jgi:hypothetical protein